MTEKPPPSPALIKLAQPEKLSKVLKDDQDDCLPCRITGASAFIVLGAYIYFSGKGQLSQKSRILAGKSGSIGGMRGRMAGTILLSSSFVGMGLYRLVN